MKGQAIKSFGRIAEQLAQRLVNLQPFALRRHQRHADGGILQRAAKAAFALDDMLLFHPECVHHHRHGVRRDQDQQHRQIEAEFAQESVPGRRKAHQAQRQQDGDQQDCTETDGEGFEARQGDSRPQQRQDDEGKGEGQMRQRQIAEGQRSHQGQQQRIRIQPSQQAAVIGEPERRQRQHPYRLSDEPGAERLPKRLVRRGGQSGGQQRAEQWGKDHRADHEAQPTAQIAQRIDRRQRAAQQQSAYCRFQQVDGGQLDGNGAEAEQQEAGEHDACAAGQQRQTPMTRRMAIQHGDRGGGREPQRREVMSLTG